jgi:L-ectoine synthase
MFVRTLDELEKLGRIKFPADASFRSARFVTAADGMGFSYNENRVKKGTNLVVWLKHHWEANYIVSGKGEVTDLMSGEVWPLEAGVLYVVGPNDRHRLHLSEDECHVSVFCPPLTGDERFDEDGSYEASGPIEETDRRMFVKRADEMRRAGSEKTTANGKGRALHMLTKVDNVGFGLSDVYLEAGTDAVFRQTNHWQANHIISGSGEVSDVTSGQTWDLEPGMAYYVGPKDRHRVRAHTDIHLLSVFSPPLQGDEQHDEDGAFAPSGPVPSGPSGY